MRPSQHRGQRIDLDADQLRVREPLASEHEKPSGSRTRIDDARRSRAVAGRPPQHRTHDGLGRVGGPLGPPDFRGADTTERRAKRIFPGLDASADCAQCVAGNGGQIARQRVFGSGPAWDVLRAERYSYRG